MNQGGMSWGIAWRSFEWNWASSLIEWELFHSAPSLRPCEKNFRLPRILMKVSPGIAPAPPRRFYHGKASSSRARGWLFAQVIALELIARRSGPGSGLV